MGFPWKKIAQVGIGVASSAVPGIGMVVETIESIMPDAKGAQKHDAAVTMAGGLMANLDAFKHLDTNNPAVKTLIGDIVNLEVALRNSYARLQALDQG